MKKVSVIGGGNVGATVLDCLARYNILKEIAVVDVKKGVAEGKALDIWESAPLHGFATRIVGATDDYSITRGSDVVVITAGVPRKPGMSRDDLIEINYRIVAECTEKALRESPDAIIVVVSNPLDVMTYCAWDVSGLPPHRVMGMSGVLDTARLRTFIGEELGVAPSDVQTLILGGHGDTMVPLTRYTTVSGIPISELLPSDKIKQLCERAKYGGGEIVNLLGTSAWYAPGAAVADMLLSIITGHRRIFPACVYLNGEYGVKGLFVGVPAIISDKGVEKVIELALNQEEKDLFMKSVNAVRELVDVYKRLKGAKASSQS